MEVRVTAPAAGTHSSPVVGLPLPEPSATASVRPDGYDPTRDAAADIAAAQRAAAKDGRPVLIDFGADWCPDCVVLGRTFTQPGTAELLSKYHVVKVDVGQFDHNLAVVRRYVNLNTSGIPALAVVDSRGRTEVATNRGEFANARSMPAAQVNAFLSRWA
ncbi:thioredoxin family protein [Actinacidiphila acididurans]|uniref:Thioredoxin family protein n=1 Tax=Actinacidiphila acididurans TaxID=2784346 RepID=A0ABS2TXM9_9ACTN|nr:thioredoxin family protein [Actinacidiphila acididurans]MBM9507837.1 thioredoxin family protein [Actinacidiphila acididurans]